MVMKFLLFERSAIETLVSVTEFQSVEFDLGSQFIKHICGEGEDTLLNGVIVGHTPDGVFFVGNRCEKEFFLIDLTQCNIFIEKESPSSLLLVIQKSFRTIIRIWNHQPFTSSERIHESKSIIFPFTFTDRRRIVIERAVKSQRLEKRGIIRPLLAYKYNAEDAPRWEESPDLQVLRGAGELYLQLLPDFINKIKIYKSDANAEDPAKLAIVHTTTTEQVSGGGFVYLNYEQQIGRLTVAQRSVVENPNISSPIRVDGPAGTGKTASLILRAYTLLQKYKKMNNSYRIIFFAHSESTKCEIEKTFSLFPESDIFLSRAEPQQIEFITLFEYCKSLVKIEETQVIDNDATDSKQYQRLLIEDALNKVFDEKYRTFKPLLSNELITIFEGSKTSKGVLLSMLQHEFSIQIKGRTNGTIEEYYKLQKIENALPVQSERDKEFIFHIFLEYQKMLRTSSVFDTDDITLQALAQWNAPFWRREREKKGYDYIFVDEMHLFNINEQHTFHYLTKDITQKHIPICFALDYSQAIGDRGNINADYIEIAFGDAERKNYQTVFRSSQQITEFCESISASGALMFQGSYKNPYVVPQSGFTQQEEARCQHPRLYMCNDENAMLVSIKEHIDDFKRDLLCNNYEIAVIVFDEKLLFMENISNLERITGKSFYPLKDRNNSLLDKNIKSLDKIIISAPNNVNGLEFQGVILVGVDEGRVPLRVGVGDISEHYIRYMAYNQLYLASSRAKYRLVLLGNHLHGESSCLKYALENNKLEKEITK